MTTEEQDTMRTKVLDAMLALFPARSGEGGPDFESDYGLAFSLATREPLGALPKGKISSLGIYGGTAQRSDTDPFVAVTMPCVAEVKITKEQGIAIARSTERYLGVVEKVLMANTKLGGLVFDISITSDMVEIDTPYDDQADGALYFDVKWHQRRDDPTKGRT